MNEDGTLNSPGSPAAPGSVILFYATGLGVVPPATDDGVITQIAVPVDGPSISVSIDGQPAEVLYVGTAPGLVAGVFQIQVRVPDVIQAGSAIAVSVQVNEFVGESGVTIAIE